MSLCQDVVSRSAEKKESEARSKKTFFPLI